MSSVGPVHGAFFALLIVVALVWADWLLGILASMRLGIFDASQLPRQLLTFVLPYVGALSVVWALQWIANNAIVPNSATAGLATVFSYFADATVVPKVLPDILGKLSVIATGPPAAQGGPAQGGPAAQAPPPLP